MVGSIVCLVRFVPPFPKNQQPKRKTPASALLAERSEKRIANRAHITREGRRNKKDDQE
jgi:hypothetical protein